MAAARWLFRATISPAIVAGYIFAMLLFGFIVGKKMAMKTIKAIHLPPL